MTYIAGGLAVPNLEQAVKGPFDTGDTFLLILQRVFSVKSLDSDIGPVRSLIEVQEP